MSGADTVLEDLLAPRIVTLRGRQVEVPGITIVAAARLIKRFRGLADAAAARKAEDIADIVVALGPEAVGAVIAAGLGACDNKRVEADAQRLPLGPQLSLLVAIFEETVPDGVGPFVAELEKLVGTLQLDDLAGKIKAAASAAMDSPPSPAASTPFVPPDTPPPKSAP